VINGRIPTACNWCANGPPSIKHRHPVATGIVVLSRPEPIAVRCPEHTRVLGGLGGAARRGERVDTMRLRGRSVIGAAPRWFRSVSAPMALTMAGRGHGGVRPLRSRPRSVWPSCTAACRPPRNPARGLANRLAGPRHRHRCERPICFVAEELPRSVRDRHLFTGKKKKAIKEKNNGGRKLKVAAGAPTLLVQPTNHCLSQTACAGKP